MIPKIIHYCWFGKKEKPKSVKRYIDQWKKILPDYEIIEWNEDNFDITSSVYCRQAYDMKKYAFVSDMARLHALYLHGGVYLDTDIEIKKDFSSLLEQHEMILGYENNGNQIMTAFMAATKHNETIKQFIALYDQEQFIGENGELNVYPNTFRFTEFLKKQGMELNGLYQQMENGISIFPEVYFSAMKFSTLTEISNQETYTVHHFDSSWKPWYVRARRAIKKIICSLFGAERVERVITVLKRSV